MRRCPGSRPPTLILGDVPRFVRNARDSGHSCILIAHNIRHVFRGAGVEDGIAREMSGTAHLRKRPLHTFHICKGATGHANFVFAPTCDVGHATRRESVS
jgi:hypothetical protein